jgi:hypothetical protein
MVPRLPLAAALALAACAQEPAPSTAADAARPPPDPAASIDAGGPPALPAVATPPVMTPADPPQSCVDCPPRAPVELVVKFLGIGGFTLDVGADRVLTAPMYSNPSLSSVIGGSIAADPERIDRFVGADADRAKVILVGHAHYDHLMDVPWVWPRTDRAYVLGNVDMKRVLAAFAPDRDPSCGTSTAALPQIPRDRVVALNDPARDRVDYRLCTERQGRCVGAFDGRPGEWFEVPNSNVRIRALCSSHPDQFLFIHFGTGCVDRDLCEPPARAADWREGSTLAYLIDFLDPGSGEVSFRVYYQDAPTDGPVGQVHPDLLAEKAIDLALLCVGSYDQVRDAPGEIIAALSPRYVIAGHWESLFRPLDEPLEPIPFLDLAEYQRRLAAAMPPGSSPPARVNGQLDGASAWMPAPGTVFALPGHRR